MSSIGLRYRGRRARIFTVAGHRLWASVGTPRIFLPDRSARVSEQAPWNQGLVRFF